MCSKWVHNSMYNHSPSVFMTIVPSLKVVSKSSHWITYSFYVYFNLMSIYSHAYVVLIDLVMVRRFFNFIIFNFIYKINKKTESRAFTTDCNYSQGSPHALYCCFL